MLLHNTNMLYVMMVKSKRKFFFDLPKVFVNIIVVMY